MKRHIPGLHCMQQLRESPLDGAFLVRVAKANYQWHSQKPFFTLQFNILGPKCHEGRSFSGRLYSTPKALWKLNWFLRDFGYDLALLQQDQIDEKALVNLRGVVRTSRVILNSGSYQNLEAFAPAADWDVLYCEDSSEEKSKDRRNDFQSHSNQ